MLPNTMWELLLSHNIYVIALGDPGQLSPINPLEDNHILEHPHVFLDEIMRQALDSGIIRLSMLIREGKSIDNFKSDDALVLSKNKLNTGMLQWADQILCATNATRFTINKECRQLRGFTKPVEENEKVIILSNNWSTVAENTGNALTNGCTGILTNVFEQNWYYPSFFEVKNNRLPILSANFTTFEYDNFGLLDFDKQLLTTGNKYLTPIQEYKIRKSKKFAGLIPYELAYGYAITVWKAQGSSWPKVLAMEENFPKNREEHKKFLYTAITRAEQKIVLVRS